MGIILGGLLVDVGIVNLIWFCLGMNWLFLFLSVLLLIYFWIRVCLVLGMGFDFGGIVGLFLWVINV